MYSFQVIVNIERKELHVDFFFFCVGCGSIPDLILSTNEKNKQTTGTRSIFHVPALVMERNQSIDPFNRFPPNSTRTKKKKSTNKKKKRKERKRKMVLFSFSLFCFIFISDLVESFDIQTLYEESVPVSFYKKKRKDEKISMSICLLANNSTLSSSVLSVGCCFFFWVSALFFCFRSEATGSSCRGLFWSFSYLYFSIRLVSNTALVWSRFFSKKKNIKKRVFFSLFFPVNPMKISLPIVFCSIFFRLSAIAISSTIFFLCAFFLFSLSLSLSLKRETNNGAPVFGQKKK